MPTPISSRASSQSTLPTVSQIPSPAPSQSVSQSTQTNEDELFTFQPDSYFSQDETASQSQSATPTDSQSETSTESQSETSSSSQSETSSDSCSGSEIARRNALPRSPSLTFFDTPLRRTTGRYADHINVVNIDGFRTAPITCPDHDVLDMLCEIIPRADEYTMRMLACLQTLRLEALTSELFDLEIEHRRIERLASSVVQEISEREDTEEFEFLELFCQLAAQHEVDEELESNSSKSASHDSQLNYNDSEEEEPVEFDDSNCVYACHRM